MTKPKIVVTVFGGVVTGVFSDTPASVLLVDFDGAECADDWKDRLGWEPAGDLTNPESVDDELGGILIDVGEAPEWDERKDGVPTMWLQLHERMRAGGRPILVNMGLATDIRPAFVDDEEVGSVIHFPTGAVTVLETLEALAEMMKEVPSE